MWLSCNSFIQYGWIQDGRFQDGCLVWVESSNIDFEFVSFLCPFRKMSGAYGWGNGFSRDIPRSGYSPLVLFIMAKHDEKRSELYKQMVFTAKVIDSCWAFFYIVFHPASAALTWSRWRNIVITVGNALQQLFTCRKRRIYLRRICFTSTTVLVKT